MLPRAMGPYGKGTGKVEEPKGKGKDKGKADEPKGKGKDKGKADEPKGSGKIWSLYLKVKDARTEALRLGELAKAAVDRLEAIESELEALL